MVDFAFDEAIKRDILHNATSNIRTCPSFDPCSVLSVRHSYIRGGNVLDDIEHSRVLAQGANGNTVGASTVEVCDQNIGRIGFERDTIVSVIYDRVPDDNIVAAVDVPSIRILGGMRGGRSGVNFDILVDDIFTLVDQVMPLWTISHGDVVHNNVSCLRYRQNNRTQ